MSPLVSREICNYTGFSEVVVMCTITKCKDWGGFWSTSSQLQGGNPPIHWKSFATQSFTPFFVEIAGRWSGQGHMSQSSSRVTRKRIWSPLNQNPNAVKGPDPAAGTVKKTKKGEACICAACGLTPADWSMNAFSV
eukprot:6460420-Amphidinium_carterae.1